VRGERVRRNEENKEQRNRYKMSYISFGWHMDEQHAIQQGIIGVINVSI
jgi:hypothetical protein